MPMRPCVCTYFMLKNENRFHLSRQCCSSHSFDCNQSSDSIDYRSWLV